MNKELIPWDLADELKELGFQGGQGRVYQQDLGMCEQILWQQAFRWFREKYGLYGIIAPRFYGDGSLWYVSEEIVISRNNIDTLNNNLFKGVFEMYPTYEEAELACLKKLIEIAKQK